MADGVVERLFEGLRLTDVDTLTDAFGDSVMCKVDAVAE